MTRRAAFDTQDELLCHAGRIFAESGYEGASMSRIAREAGVSKGTPYNYFGSKAELFAAYVRWECRNSLAVVFEGLDREPDVATALGGVGQGILQVIFSPKGIAVYRIVTAEAAKVPELAQAFFEAGPAWAVRHLAEWLAARTRTGALRVPDPELAAEQFFALCRTRYGMRRELRLIDSIPADGLQQVVDATVSLFLAAYGPAPGPPAG